MKDVIIESYPIYGDYIGRTHNNVWYAMSAEIGNAEYQWAYKTLLAIQEVK